MDRFCPRVAPRRRSQFSRPRPLAPILSGLLIALAAFFSPQIVSATDGSWNANATGLWSDSNNWYLNQIADGSDATANFTFNISGPITVILDTSRTLGILNIGDPDSGSSYLIDSIAGSSLIFDSSTNAQINVGVVGSAGDTIDAPIILRTSLDISNSGSSTFTILGTIGSDILGPKTISLLSGNAVLSGVISNGTGGGTMAVNQSGTGILTLSGANTYTGGTTVTNGTLALGADSIATTINPKVIVSSAVGLGTLTLGNGATMRSDSTFARTVMNNISMSGNITLGSSDLSFNGSLALNGTNLTTKSTVTLTGDTALTVLSPVTIVDVINDGGSGFSLTKDGAAQLILSGLNTYSGGTIVNGGELTIGVNEKITGGVISGAIGSGTLTLTDGAAVDTSKGVTIANAVVMSGNITLGELTTNNKKLTFDSTGLAIPNTVTLAGNTKLTMGNPTGTDVTIVDVITGNFSLTKDGTGDLVLSGDNTYTGGTIITEGTLLIGADERLANSGALTVAGGTFNLNNHSETVGTVTLTGGSIITGTLTGSSYDMQNGSVSAVLAGTAALTKSTTGTVTLSGANTYTGTTTVNGGQLNVTGSLGNTDVTVNSGGNLGGTGTIGTTSGGSVTVASGGAINLVNGSTDTLTIQTTTGGNTALTLNGGSINFEIGSGLTSDKIAVANGSLLNLTGSVTLNITGLSGFGQGTYTLITFAGMNGGGSFTLGTTPGGAFSYALGSNSTSEFLTVGQNAPTGTAYWKGGNGTTWNADNWFTDSTGTTGTSIPGSITDVFFTTTNAVSFSTTLGADFSIQSLTIGTGLASTNPVSIGGANTLTLGTGGLTVQAGAAAVTLSTKVALGADQTWTNNSANALTVSGIVSGAQALTKAGTGTLKLSGANTYSGGTILSAGTLQLGNTKAIGTGTFTIGDGTTIDSSVANLVNANNNVQNWNGDFTFTGTQNLNLGTGAVTMNANRQVTVSANTLTIGGAIGDGGNTYSLTKAGGGILVLSGANTYTGATTISAGSLQLGSGGATGSLSTSSTITDNGNFTINRNNAVTQGTTFSGSAITGTGSFTQAGTGTTTLTAANSYTGATTVSAGTLAITGTLGNTAVSVNGGTLSLQNASAISQNTVTLGGGALTETATNALSGTAALTLNTGTATLSQDNNYSGGTTLNGGTLNLNSAGALGSGAFTIAGGTIDNTSAGAIILTTNNTQTWAGSFTFTGTKDLNLGTGNVTLNANPTVTTTGGNLTVGGVIADGTGNSLTKAGAGTLTLTGANTYDGTTTISAGKLVVNGSLGSTAVSVNSGGVLAGTGTIGTTSGGSVTVNSGGAINLVNGSIGPLTIQSTSGTNALTLAGGSINFELGTGGADLIALANGTNLLLSGSVTLNITGISTFSAGTYNLITFNNISGLGSFSLGTTPGGAFNYSLNTAANAEQLIVTAVTTAYWRGDQGNVWNTPSSGPSNWYSDSGGTANLDSFVPGANNDVVFATSNATNTANLATTLGQNITIKSLTILGTDLTQSNSVSIDGGGLYTLTITPTSGAAGITVNSGAMGLTITANVGLGANQIWTNNSTNLLTVSGVVSGAFSLTKAGTGTGALVLSGANTYSGGTILSAGTLALGSSGVVTGGTRTSGPVGTGTLTLGDTTTLRSNSTTARTIQNNLSLNGNITLGDATNNGTLTFNSTDGVNTLGTAATATLTGATTLTTLSPVAIADVISGAFSLTKAGAGTLTLSGANTYSGLTTVSAGILNIQNAAALGPSAGTGTTVSSGATLQLQGGLTFNTEALTINGTGAAAGQNGALVNVSGTNNYGGLLTLGAASTISSDGGTLNLTNAGTITGSGFALTLTGSGNGSVSSIIGTGAGTLTKSGTGTWILSGANTYTGATSITAGVLNIQNALATGTTAGGVTVSNNAALQIQNGIAVGNEALTLNGSGISSDGALRNISGANSWSGALTLGSASTIASDSGTLTLSGTINKAGFLLTVGGAGNVTASGVVSGAGGLLKTGAGQLTLTKSNTFTGGVTINAGTLTAGNNNAIGNGTNALTFGAASTGKFQLNDNDITVIDLNTDANVGTPIIENGSSAHTGVTLTVNTVNNDIYAGVFQDGSTQPLLLTKSGTGSLTLSGNNTYTGATLVSAGILNIQSNNALGSTTGSTTVSNNATLQLQGGITVPAEALNIRGVGASGQTGALVNVSGTNNYGGLLTLAAATTISSDSGALNLTNTGTIIGNNFALTLTGSGNGSIASIIGTTGGTLTKNGTGTWTLTGANTYTGATSITAGVLNIQNNTALGTTAGGTTVSGGAALQVQGGIAVGELALTLNGSGISSDGALRNISGNNSFSSAITLGSATTIDSDANTLTLSGGITNGGNLLTVTGAGSTTISTAAITGSGGLTKTGTGTLTLGAGGSIANTYSGLTTVTAGELDLNKATGTNAIAGNVTINGGTLKWLASDQIANTATISMSSGALSLNNFNETITSFTNSGGTFTTGTGHLTGTGASVTWSGGTNTVNNGGTVEDGHVLITGGINTVEGGATGGVLKINSGGTGLEMTGSTLTLNSDAAVAGKLLLLGNVITNASGATSTIASGFFNTNPGTIDLNTGTRTFTVADGAAATDMSISALITNGGLTKAGLGLLNLSGANTYSSGTTVNAGTLQASGSGTLGASTGSLTVNTGGTLDVNGTNQSVGALSGTGGTIVNNASSTSKTLTVGNGNGSGSYAGVIADNNNAGSGILAFTKAGTGTQTLTGTNTYTGGTTVSAGKLLVNNTSGSGTGTGSVTVTGNATVLGGSGTISGAVGIGNGTDAPILRGGTGATASGSLTVGSLTMNSGSIVQLALGPSLTHSTLALTGAYSFQSNQTFQFINLGATTGTYDNIITGVTGADPRAGWQFDNSFNPNFAGTFIFDDANNAVDLNLTFVPEPSTWAGGALALAALLITQRGRLKKLIRRA